MSHSSTSDTGSQLLWDPSLLISHVTVYPRYQAAGIDSPGLAGSPAIAIHVVKLLRDAGLDAQPNPTFNPYRRPIIRPKDGWKGIKIGHKDPEKNVVCKCEKVTEAEIVDAIRRPLRCISTQAVRKRTRAGMGHCQGSACLLLCTCTTFVQQSCCQSPF